MIPDENKGDFVMPKCFKSSLLTMSLFIVYLFLFDFVWLLLPNLSSSIVLIGTIAMLIISFKLAMMTSDKFFQVIGNFQSK